MKQQLKYLLSEYAPNSIKYAVMFRNFFRGVGGAFKRLVKALKYTHFLEKSKYFDSKNITYKDVIISTFSQCYDTLKPLDMIYFGEATTGCHRFILIDDKSTDLIPGLIELLDSGYSIDVYKNEQLTDHLYGNKKISTKKILNTIKDFNLLRIYKIYKNTSGIIEFGSKTAFEIDRWYKIDNIYHTKSRNNIQNILTEENLGTTIDISLYGKSIRQLEDTFKFYINQNKNRVKEVDLVYTWVNGDDPKWLNKKLKYTNEGFSKQLHNSAAAFNRFISRDELKYSLRSVEKYLDGYRKIFIVTDGQKPDWLLESDKIIIVDHKDIFPDKNVLPVFNSHAIEACLHLIEGLSEHYLYLNDDFLFFRSINVSAFFPEKGKISIFPSNQTFIPFGSPSKDLLPVDTAAINTRTLLEREELGYAINKFKHTPYPQIKSIFFELEKLFEPEIKLTRSSRFRQPTDLSITSSLLFNYTYLKGIAEKKSIKYSYIHLGSDTYQFNLTKITIAIETQRPDVVCINDIDEEYDKEEVGINFAKIMNNFLPESSKFEKLEHSQYKMK